jgi:hypothetical protein
LLFAGSIDSAATKHTIPGRQAACTKASTITLR